MSGAKKSPFAIRMDDIQKIIDPDLKRLGFRKSARTYNRSPEEGLVQVINFQMGPYEPPLPYVSPVPQWLKSDVYGKFAVNLGIYVDEVSRAEGYPKPGKFVSEFRCRLRIRLGHLINLEGEEFWWRLDMPADEIAKEVATHLLSDGIAFLDRFGSRSAIIRDWVKFNDTEIETTVRAMLDVGIMLAAKGDRAQAAALFRQHLALPGTNQVHKDYVLGLAKKFNLDVAP